MEENDEKPISIKNGISTLKLNTEHITMLDLNNKNISIIDENMLLPVNLTELYLMHNELSKVPVTVLNLKKIKILDISYNKIQYFDDTPNFSETIEQFNISNNELLGPPYWLWAKNCTNLVDVNLSFNKCLTKSFVDGYFEELLGYDTRVTNLKINNCSLIKHLKLLGTFPKAKVLTIGNSEVGNLISTNKTEEVPCSGLDKCCDIEILNLSNTSIYHVTSNINIYKNIKEINLSLNKISGLPEEFCSLVNLEVCVLSYNNILLLPDSFNKLKKLRNLLLNSNSLCMLPEHLCKLPHLNRLDLYDNNLYEAPDEIETVLEIDLAQNYFDEPDNEDYIKKKEKIRSNDSDRYDGRKLEQTQPESEYSKDGTDDELIFDSKNDEQDTENRPLSSPDWDSDEYWIPHNSDLSAAPKSDWLWFVKRKMEEGNFCPMDAHPVSIAECVKYAKLCNPKPEYESDGQFDDFSGDDS